MSVKDWFELGWQVTLIVMLIAYVGINVYKTKKPIKDKWVLQIESLADAFVHAAEKTDGHGEVKMKIVIDSVIKILADHGVKVDPTIEAMIRAYAEKAVAKMNVAKPDKTYTEVPVTADDYDENNVKDETEEPETNAGADENA